MFWGTELLNYMFDIFSKLLTLSMGNQKSTGLYVFKAFEYEKVTPSQSDCKIPFPRSGHRIVCDDKNLYSFGGYNPLLPGNEEDTRDDDDFSVNSYPLFKELWKFNFATKRWTRYNSRHSLPMELASNAVIREGNFLMVYGCVSL